MWKRANLAAAAIVLAMLAPIARAEDAKLNAESPSRHQPAQLAPHRPSRLLPATLIVTGAIPLVAGAVVSYYTPVPDPGPQPKYLFSTPAIGVSVAGGLTVAAGVYLWFRGERPASSPTVTQTRGGGIVGWVGTF